MALVDITNGWESGGGTEIYMYPNSETLTYSYSAGASESSAHGLVEAGYLNTQGSTPYNNAYSEASIQLSSPVEGFTMKFNDFEGGAFQINVDGVDVDLNTLLANGDITLSHSGSRAPADMITDDGRLGYNDGLNPSTNGTLTFNIPVQNVTITEAGTITGGGHDGVRVDFFVDDQKPPSLVAPCFTLGTLIETDKGPVPVETLQAGDMIKTKDHGFQPVKWVGGSRVHDAPVRIKAGTFGNARDLVVSPRHRMLLQGWQMGLLFNHDEAFACAKDMQNGTTITMEPEGWVTYYHVLLDRHEVIFAEGAETESFFPDEASLNGMAKATREELAQMVDLSTFGRTVRPTLSANQAMYLSHNMDLLEDEPNQIAAQ